MTRELLRILQYNMQKRLNAVQVPFLQSPKVKEFDIVAVQEQGRSDRAPQTFNPSYSQFHLVANASPLSRACIYVNKAIDPSTWSVTTTEPDFCSIKMRVQDGAGAEVELQVHNIYNPSPVSTTSTEGPSTLPRLQGALQSDGPHLAVGDFNLHHPYWGGTGCYSRHSASDALIEIATQAQLDLNTPPGTITREVHLQKTTIDLSWGQRWVADRILRCAVREDLHQGSDHLPIETVLQLGTREAHTPRRRNWKGLNPETFQEILGNNLTAFNEHTRKFDEQKGIFTELANAESKKERRIQIDRATNSLLQAIQDTIDQVVPWARPSANAKDFWTQHCSEAVAQAKRLHAEWKSDRTPEAWQRYLKGVDAKGKVIRRSKTAFFRNQVQEAGQKGDGLWKLCKWAKTKSQSPKEPPQFPPLLRQNGEGVATTFGEKTEILRAKFFPTPRAAELSDIGDAQYPGPLCGMTLITTEEISRMISRLHANKAPGPSGIPNRVLKAGGDVLIGALAQLFNACLTEMYHPLAFREAVTIVLRKPKKGDYTDPRSYRPIALLETAGKVLEMIMAERLSGLAEEHALLPEEQMGARKGRSTDTALELLTEHIHTVWGCGTDNVASMLSLDMSGAFDHVAHTRLLHNLRKRGIPEYIVGWTESFLSERRTSLRFDGKTSAVRPVSAGIPQGSPVSPILFLFFNANLIEDCQAQGLAISTLGFVDDINILAYGRSTEANCRTLKTAHDTCLRWARTHGAAFAPEKYELVHFTRTPRRFDMTAALPLGEVSVRPKESARVLGVQVDSKLRWGPHIRNTEAKHATQVLALSQLGGSTWGATFSKARCIYRAVVLPALTYGAQIWHQRGARGAPKGKERRLEVCQNQALRNISGAFKKTCTKVLEAETFIPPIDIALDRLQDRAVWRGRAARTNKAIERVKGVIRARLSPIIPKAGHPPTPSERRASTLNEILRGGADVLRSSPQRSKRGAPYPPPPLQSIEAYHFAQWEKRWEVYKRQLHEARMTAAQAASLSKATARLRGGLKRAESSLALQIRTETIGLKSYLYGRGVPGVDSPRCDCGHQKQTAKHIVVFCPKWTGLRQRIFVTELSAGRTLDYRSVTGTTAGLRKAAHLLIETGLLQQFEMAKSLLDSEVR